MSRFLFRASKPDVVVSLTEVGAVWGLNQPHTKLHRVSPLATSAQASWISQIQSCRQDTQSVQSVRGGVRTQWILGSFWLNTWLQPRPTGLKSMAELEQLVKARAVQLFGPAPDGQAWSVSADWKSRSAFICHAAPASALAKIGADAIESPLTLALLALFRLPVVQKREPSTWVAFTAPGEVHVIAFKDGYVTNLASRRSPLGVSTLQALEQGVSMWRLEKARLGRGTERLYWLNGGLPELDKAAQAPANVTPIQTPWRSPYQEQDDVTAAERWLAWVLDLQREFK